MAAFRRYKELHGDLLVPVTFIIPSTADWPEAAWGIPLGRYTQEVRQEVYLKHHRNELTEMGFEYASTMRRFGFPLVKSAFMTHKEIFGKVRLCP